MLVVLDDRRLLHHHEVDVRARALQLVVVGEPALGGRRHGRVLVAALGVVGLAGIHFGVRGGHVGAGRLLVAELVVVPAEQVDCRVEAHLRHLHDAAEALEHAVGARGVRQREVVQDAAQRRRDEEVAAAGGDLPLVHVVGHGAQGGEHVHGRSLGEVLGLHGHALGRGDLAEGVGVALGGHLRALKLGTSLDEAVEHAALLHVHHVGEEPYGPVVAEAVRLVLVGDGACLVPYVAGVVPEPRDGDLRDEDLLGVAARADHAPAAVQAARHRRPLIDLVQNAGVVLRELDAVSHLSALLCFVVGIVKAGELSPAPHGLAGVRARACVGKTGLSALLLCGGVCEQPRLGLL